MFLNPLNAALLCALVVTSIHIQRSGWLDRMVEHRKEEFYTDLLELAPMQIEATIQYAPPGYKDSEAWTVDSVMHLLILISESEKARPVRATLMKMLQPTRRILSMSKQKSYRIFPSLSKHVENYLYYEMDTDEEYIEPESKFIGIPDDQAVVVVSNPVEARLPSAQISVRLLRDILESRAQAARIMPSTTRSTFSWKKMNATKAVTANSTTPAGDDDKETTVSGTTIAANASAE